jgi:hypothetical protein
MTCAWFELLSRIPFTSMRLSLCRRHADGCPRCLRESGSGESLPPLLVTADRLSPGLDLWPGVKGGINGLQRPAGSPAVIPLSARKSLLWAYAAAMLALLLFAGTWIVLRYSVPQPGPEESRPAPQTRLCSAKVADRPARVFQVQSRNPDRTIFWIARDNSRS